MDCHSNHSIFLRSNGSLSCWDDAGSRLTLKEYDPDIDYSKDVVFGDVYAGLRNKLKQGIMPFPNYCRDCLIFASGACFNPRWEERKEIQIFQVEPAIACTLECPGCMTFAERKLRHGRLGHLDLSIFEKYLSDFKADGVTIRTIDFQGHGEPLLNRNVWKMASLAKSYFPSAKISMCTNAHGKYDRSHVLSGIDEMMFAIDGIDQESFGEYRVRGDFEKAYSYMKSFCLGAAEEGRSIKTIWKYIMFDCNSSDAQLLRAQEMAVEAGVDEILFVNTQLGLKMSRTLTLDQIPRLDSDLIIRVSNYLCNVNDVLHAIDKARFALSQGDRVHGESNLAFAANMIRRRFECIEDADVMPKDYQALVYELLDLSDTALMSDDARAGLRGGLHLLLDKLEIGAVVAKDRIISWKHEEIKRLSDQLSDLPRRTVSTVCKTIFTRAFNRFDRRLKFKSLRARNLIIKWQSEKVMQLAKMIDEKSGPDVSVF